MPRYKLWCANVHQTADGPRECGQVFVSISEPLLTTMRAYAGTDDGRLTVRCKSCSGVCRFASIYFEGDVLKFEALESGKIDLGTPVQYGKKLIFAEVGGTKCDSEKR